MQEQETRYKREEVVVFLTVSSNQQSDAQFFA